MSFQPQSDNVMITLDTSVVLSNQSQDLKKSKGHKAFVSSSCKMKTQYEENILVFLHLIIFISLLLVTMLQFMAIQSYIVLICL